MEKLYSCYKCKEKKPRECFYKDKTRKTGIGSRCKHCDAKSGKRSIIGQLKFKLTSNIRKRLKHVIKGKSFTTQNLGCTRDELIKWLENHFKDGMSWDNYGFGPGKWVIDHIRPISNFLKTGDDPKKANHFSNLQPLWYEENRDKSDKFDF